MSTRPYYDTDDAPFRPRLPGRSGWGLLAAQVFGIGHYIPPTKYSARALCAETDPDLFFPEKSTGAWQVRLARRICENCPIREECLEDALTRWDEFGVWGGTTPRQRQAIRMRRNETNQPLTQETV